MVWLKDMGNSCTSVFPNTHAWEQQERNKTKETDEDGKKRGVSMERSKAGTNKEVPNGLSHPNQNIIIISKIWYYLTMTFSLHQGGVVMPSQIKHTHSRQDTPLNPYT